MINKKMVSLQSSRRPSFCFAKMENVCEQMYLMKTKINLVGAYVSYA